MQLIQTLLEVGAADLPDPSVAVQAETVTDETVAGKTSLVRIFEPNNISSCFASFMAKNFYRVKYSRITHNYQLRQQGYSYRRLFLVRVAKVKELGYALEVREKGRLRDAAVPGSADDSRI